MSLPLSARRRLLVLLLALLIASALGIYALGRCSSSPERWTWITDSARGIDLTHPSGWSLQRTDSHCMRIGQGLIVSNVRGHTFRKSRPRLCVPASCGSRKSRTHTRSSTSLSSPAREALTLAPRSCLSTSPSSIARPNGAVRPSGPSTVTPSTSWRCRRGRTSPPLTRHVSPASSARSASGRSCGSKPLPSVGLAGVRRGCHTARLREGSN